MADLYTKGAGLYRRSGQGPVSKDRSRSPVQGNGYKRVNTNKISKVEG